MNHCERIEKDGEKLIMPLLETMGRVVKIEGAKAQRERGDFDIYQSGGEMFSLELKTEESHKTGNIFLETWSSRAPAPHRRKGWIETLDTDAIAFLFLDCKRIFWFDFKALKFWVEYEMHLTHFPQKQAGMSERGEQMNRTWGYCVPSAYMMSILDLRGESYRMVGGEWRKDNIAEPLPPSKTKDVWSGFIEG